MQSCHIQLALSFASLGPTYHKDPLKHCKFSCRNRAQEGCRVQECTPASGAILQERGTLSMPSPAYLPPASQKGENKGTSEIQEDEAVSVKGYI